MLIRILTSLVGLAVFFAVIFAHEYVLSGAIAVIALLMLYEVYGAMDTKKELRGTGYAACLMMFASVFAGKPLLAFYAAIILFMAVMVFTHGKVKCSEALSTAAITVFISASMLSLVFIRSRFGVYAVIMPFVVAWLTDTGAYFAGSLLGKHKLVPQISPKKTVEGAIGGILLASASVVVFGMIFAERGIGTADIVKLVAVGAVGSVVSQVGDLAASCIKRDFGKKDYGTALPGHGGFMDRFDSVLFAAPFVYFALQFFGI